MGNTRQGEREAGEEHRRDRDEPQQQQASETRIDVIVDQVSGVGDVHPEEGEREAGQADADRVQHHRGRVVHVLTQHGGRDRQQHDGEQEEAVQEKKPVVRVDHAPEHPVMTHPEPTDHREAEQEAEQRRSQATECSHQILMGQPRRHLQVEDEERDGDGHDGVREPDQPVDLGADRGLDEPLARSTRLVSLPVRRRGGGAGSCPGRHAVRACHGCIASSSRGRTTPSLISSAQRAFGGSDVGAVKIRSRSILGTLTRLLRCAVPVLS